MADERPQVVEPGVADPAPLGLSAFALTTFLFSVVNAGLISPEIQKLYLPLAFVYGGLAQLLAGMWEFRNRNTFAATGFGSFGAFWIALGIQLLFARQLGIAEEHLPRALAWTFLAWAIFTAILLIATFGINVGLVVVFLLLLATFVLLAIGEFAGGPEGAGMPIVKIGGYVGIVTAAAAWYVAAADVINDTFGRTVLPVGPLGGGS